MPLIADLIMIGLFGYLCWQLTDGFRRNVAFMVPMLLVAGFLRFVALPMVIKSLFVF